MMHQINGTRMVGSAGSSQQRFLANIPIVGDLLGGLFGGNNNQASGFSQTTPQPQPQTQENNTMMYVLIGFAALLLIMKK